MDRLRRLLLSTWSYGRESAEIRHLEPMAQDFWAAAFGLGDSDRRVDLGDAIGVCMTAICALADRIDDIQLRLAATTGTENSA